MSATCVKRSTEVRRKSPELINNPLKARVNSWWTLLYPTLERTLFLRDLRGGGGEVVTLDSFEVVQPRKRFSLDVHEWEEKEDTIFTWNKTVKTFFKHSVLVVFLFLYRPSRTVVKSRARKWLEMDWNFSLPFLEQRRKLDCCKYDI